MADDAETRDENPWSQRSFMLAGGLVAIIALLAVVLTVTGSGEESTAPGVSEVDERPPMVSRAEEDGCQLPAGSQTVPTGSLSDTDWELVGRMAVPVAPEQYGPASREDGVASCYAQSPIGVLYAAANVIAAMTVPEKREAAADRLMARGPGRERLIAAIEATNEPGEAEGGLQIAGFAFESYDGSSAVIDLALETTTAGVTNYDQLRRTGLVHLPMVMRREGDWKLSIPETGNPFGALERLPDLDGYTAWSGA